MIKRILSACFKECVRRKLHARNLGRINAAAYRLNIEAADVLKYQAS